MIATDKIKISIRKLGTLYPTFLVSDFNNSKLFGNITSADSIGSLINGIFKIAIIVGAMLAVLRLVYAGFLYMGTDLFDRKSAAKEAIQNAIIGLLLLVTTYIILNQINPDLLKLNITQNIKPATGSTSGGSRNADAPISPMSNSFNDGLGNLDAAAGTGVGAGAVGIPSPF